MEKKMEKKKSRHSKKRESKPSSLRSKPSKQPKKKEERRTKSKPEKKSSKSKKEQQQKEVEQQHRREEKKVQQKEVEQPKLRKKRSTRSKPSKPKKKQETKSQPEKKSLKSKKEQEQQQKEERREGKAEEKEGEQQKSFLGKIRSKSSKSKQGKGEQKEEKQQKSYPGKPRSKSSKSKQGKAEQKEEEQQKSNLGKPRSKSSKSKQDKEQQQQRKAEQQNQQEKLSRKEEQALPPKDAPQPNEAVHKPFLRKKPSTTASKQFGPIIPKNEKSKPLFINHVASSEESAAAKQTLSTLRTLFASETTPYYDQFSTGPHQTCCALVFAAICCFFKICLYGFMVGMTIIFHIGTLNYLLDAFENVYEGTTTTPAIPEAIIQTLHSLCIGIYAFCSAAILVDLSLIAASFLRHIRAISFSIAAGFFVNFWAIFFMFTIAVTGFNQKDLTSSLMGNLMLHDFEVTPKGKIIHQIQEQFQCCGFNDATDWHKRTMFQWEEPGIEEPRSIPYPLHWLESCGHSYVCYSPKSCCITDSKSTCNQANMTLDAFNEIVDRNFSSLSSKIKPKYSNQVNNNGCIEIIGEQINSWSIYALAISISALILWITIVILLTLSLSEMSGMGSVNTRTSMIDPKSLKDIVPFGEAMDELCCCGGGKSWPIYDEGSERDAIREDRKALIAIEEGKSFKEMDLTASTSNIALFLPSMKEEIRHFDDTSGIEQQQQLPPQSYGRRKK